MFVVVVTTNSVDFYYYPYNFHICLLPSMVVPKPLETRYHSPFWFFTFVFSSISHVEMTFMVHQHFASLPVLMLAQ